MNTARKLFLIAFVIAMLSISVASVSASWSWGVINQGVSSPEPSDDKAPLLTRHVNEYEGQHRKVNEYEGQHRKVNEYEGQHLTRKINEYEGQH